MKDRNIFHNVSLWYTLHNEYLSFFFRWNKGELALPVRVLDNTAHHDKSTRYVDCWTAAVLAFSHLSGEN